MYTPHFSLLDFKTTNIDSSTDGKTVANAATVINGKRIVKLQSNNSVVLATNTTDMLYGVSDAYASEGGYVSIALSGLAYLKLGATVDISGGVIRLTTDGNGKGIPSVIGNNVIGFALENGNTDDDIKVLIAQDVIGASGGGSDAYFTTTLNTVTSPHTVTHNLAKKPSVTVIDTSNNIIQIDVNYLDDNQVVLSWDMPINLSGMVICN